VFERERGRERERERERETGMRTCVQDALLNTPLTCGQIRSTILSAYLPAYVLGLF
jgi:hypothetical protein